MRCPPLNRLLLALPLLAVLACGDDSRPTAPSVRAPSAAIEDGANGGDEHFFFLPPLAADPSGNPNFDAGEFSAAWLPTVTICLLVNGECSAGSTTVIPPEFVTVSIENEHYQASWDTNLPSYGLGLYRIFVSLPLEPTRTLGFIDIQLNQSGQAEGAGPGGIVVLNDGRVIPIKFRIEQGLTVGNTNDFLEALVTNDGGVFKTNTGHAGVFFNQGWLGDPDAQVTLTIERLYVGNGPCVASVDLAAVLQGFTQIEGCYRYNTYPDAGTVEADIVVAMCSELVSEANDARWEAQSMFKYDAPATLNELPNAPAVDANGLPWLTSADCAGFNDPPPGPTSMLWGGVKAFARGVGKVFGPNTAWAVDVGLGGKIGFSEDGFSDFFWGLPTRVDKVSGDNQTAPVGTLLPLPARVRVTGTHIHDADESTNLPGHVALPNVPVTFTVVSGGGTIGLGTDTQLTINSDASGYAQVPWVVGLDAGVNTLSATLTDDPGEFNRQKSVLFTANGTATIPRGDEIRVLGPASPGPNSNNVSLKLNVSRPFNAKLYRSGTKVENVVCTWASTKAAVVIYVPGTDPGAISMTGVALIKNAKVDITCGTAKRSLFVTVTA